MNRNSTIYFWKNEGNERTVFKNIVAVVAAIVVVVGRFQRDTNRMPSLMDFKKQVNVYACGGGPFVCYAVHLHRVMVFRVDASGVRPLKVGRFSLLFGTGNRSLRS